MYFGLEFGMIPEKNDRGVHMSMSRREFIKNNAAAALGVAAGAVENNQAEIRYLAGTFR